MSTIPYTTIDTTLRVVRIPWDMTASRIGSAEGGATALEIVVDRADADIRSFAGRVLSDDELRADAAARHAAADEREQARKLHRTAEATEDAAEARTRQREQAAERKKAAARKRASSKTEQAEQRRKAREQDAEKAARNRKTAAEHAAQERKEAADETAKRERLEALKEEERALKAKDEALTAQDEAARLADAAARAKEQRKAS